MAWFTHHDCDDPFAGAHRSIAELYALGLAIFTRSETIMIDTTKLLAAVAEERTESASLRALVAANTAALTDISAKLKTATDALAAAGADTAQLAQVQADIDQATADLSADSASSKDAVAANTPPTEPAPAPTA